MEPTDRPVAPGDADRSKRLVEVGATLLSELDLEAVLRTVLEAARELTGARYAALGVLDRRGSELERFIYLGIDEETRRRIGSLPRGRGVLGELIREPVPLRLHDVETHPHAFGFPPGHPQMHSFLGLPIRIRGEVYGNLYLTEKQGAEDFDAADQEAAQTLATWAGIAIATAQTVESERLQQQVQAAEQERQRWARELHDDTLQGLAAIRISLAAALQSDAEDRNARIAAAAEGTVAQLEGQITELSRLIDDLRPAPLERLGLDAALRALVEESANRGDLELSAEIELDAELGGEEERVVYRLAQEALNNVVKHAAARGAELRVSSGDGAVRIEVRDDGRGFDPDAAAAGRGIAGMRERVALLGGGLEISSAPDEGTVLTATLPVGRG